MDSSLKNKATASMILGIISLVTIWFGYYAIIGIICGIIGLVIGIDAKKGLNGQDGAGMATAGIVCSAIGLGLSAISFLACVACAGILGGALSSFY